jgi:hypothetical protein
MRPPAIPLPVLDVCEKLAFRDTPKVCGWCGTGLIGRRTAWCGEDCEWHFLRNHYWTYSAPAALRRDGSVCVRCGSGDRVEVNHILPIRGAQRWGLSCANHLGNLETLCHSHHTTVTRLQIVSVRSSPIGAARRTQACWTGAHEACWSQAPAGTLLGGFVVADCLCECHGPAVHRQPLQMGLGIA